jgi:hypothetical protein
MLAYIYIPVIQKELDVFQRIWNSHRIRKQKEARLPKGIPDHVYSFPEKYGAYCFVIGDYIFDCLFRSRIKIF